jgi:serine/threonine protein kinase
LLLFGLRTDGGAVPVDFRGGLFADDLIRRGVVTQWQLDMLMQGKYRGFHLGAYRILRPLGQGAMGKVFLAQHEMLGHLCAIKILPSRYQDDPKALDRFRLEARAIAKLDHPNIVRVYDFNKDVRYGKDIAFLVMEYVEGRDVRRTVAEDGPMEFREATGLMAQAADGLAYAHQAGLVHRDIEPANLLVDLGGVLKILDFGLARFIFEPEEPSQTSAGQQSAVATADYVAPEQVADSQNVDGRADIYSLGLTFYYLLTGHRPFPKATLVELLMAHRYEKPKPISDFRPDAPPELIAIIDRMIAKQPANRFQTAGEVAKALRTWLHESGGTP